MNDYILEPEPAYEPDLDAEADRHNQAWLDGLYEAPASPDDGIIRDIECRRDTEGES